MNEVSLSTWEAFEVELRRLKNSHIRSISGLLFRGQGDSSWSLETTLERNSQKQLLVKNYFGLISEVKPQIETFTNEKWDMPNYSEMDELTSEYVSFSRALSSGRLPAYRYMAYLRHHGFPSPLLDWTRSPYVAAYFAFRKPSDKEVSIFVYCDSPENEMFRSSAEPAIHRFGPNVQTHKRHFLQQSEYTVCVEFKDEWFFVSHTEVFNRDTRFDVVRQNVLWKFNLPPTERLKVLRLLDEYNLNAYSLFGSDESLMETLAFRALSSRESD